MCGCVHLLKTTLRYHGTSLLVSVELIIGFPQPLDEATKEHFADGMTMLKPLTILITTISNNGEGLVTVQGFTLKIPDMPLFIAMAEEQGPHVD